MPDKPMPDKPMPDKPMPDKIYHMHQDRWWIRALDGELTADERRAWNAHLAQCERCRLEWNALVDLDQLLAATPAPLPAPDFVAQTATRVKRTAWRRRLARLLGGFFILGVLLVVELSVVSAVFSSVARIGSVLLASRDVLFQALMRIWVSFIALGDAALPLLCIALAAGLLLVMPNGILATLTFVLLRRQRRRLALETE